MKRRLSMALLLLLCAVDPCLADGRIRGRLLLPGMPAGDASRGMMAAQGRPLDAVVYLEEIPSKSEKKLARKASKIRRTIVQEHQQFVPRVTVVAVGDSVRIQNLDNVYHSAFSVSSAQRFDLGKHPPGHLSVLAFDNPGVVNLHCDIHPRMLAFVVVLRNHAFVQPDSTGRFELPGLPRGSYTLCAWDPRLGSRSRKVEIPKRGVLDVELRF